MRTSVDIWADHEQRRLLLLADETERSTDVTSMYQWTGRLCGGVIDDVTNRWAPLFYSDWIDGISVKTVSASLLMFFNCLAPCIAFGALTAISTDNKMGTMEYLVAQSRGWGGVVDIRGPSRRLCCGPRARARCF